jgi:hypothetical protein
MEFATEQRLVDRLQQVYGSAPGSNWVWLREFTTSYGIADLLGVGLAQPTSAPSNVKASLGLVPPQWAFTLQRLPTQERFTLHDLADLALVSVSTARLMLKVFSNAGFCEPAAAPRTWVKCFALAPVATRIVAVEAKLRDWRRALYQAAQHADYATQCWVVLDQTALANAQQHDHEFEHRGVGLAGLSDDGHLDVAIEPADKVPRLPYRFWRANAEIARRLM